MKLQAMKMQNKNTLLTEITFSLLLFLDTEHFNTLLVSDYLCKNGNKMLRNVSSISSMLRN